MRFAVEPNKTEAGLVINQGFHTVEKPPDIAGGFSAAVIMHLTAFERRRYPRGIFSVALGIQVFRTMTALGRGGGNRTRAKGFGDLCTTIIRRPYKKNAILFSSIFAGGVYR